MNRDEAIAQALKQLNQPPQSRYSTRRVPLQPRKPAPVVQHESTGAYTLNEKDLGT